MTQTPKGREMLAEWKERLEGATSLSTGGELLSLIVKPSLRQHWESTVLSLRIEGIEADFVKSLVKRAIDCARLSATDMIRLQLL